MIYPKKTFIIKLRGQYSAGMNETLRAGDHYSVEFNGVDPTFDKSTRIG